MGVLIGGVDRLARIGINCGGFMIIAGAVLVTFDVLLRAIVGKSMSGADELSGYLFGIAVSWSMAYNLVNRANVRIDFAYALLPRAAQAILDLVGLLLFGGFFMLVTYHAFIVTQGSYGNLDGSGWSMAVSPMKTPLAAPQTAWLVGLVLFVLTFIAVAIRAFAALARRDFDEVNRICGARTVQEEVAEGLSLAEHEIAKEHGMSEKERLAHERKES